MSDRIFALVWLCLCGIGLFIGWGIHSEYSYEPLGPRPFPLGILVLMALCALLLLFRKADNIQWPNTKTARRLVILIIALAIYAWSFEWLGFPVATALLTITIGLLFHATPLAAIISGVIMGGSLFFLFDYLLDVTLPLGIWLN